MPSKPCGSSAGPQALSPQAFTITTHRTAAGCNSTSVYNNKDGGVCWMWFSADMSCMPSWTRCTCWPSSKRRSPSRVFWEWTGAVRHCYRTCTSKHCGRGCLLLHHTYRDLFVFQFARSPENTRAMGLQQGTSLMIIIIKMMRCDDVILSIQWWIMTYVTMMWWFNIINMMWSCNVIHIMRCDDVR